MYNLFKKVLILFSLFLGLSGLAYGKTLEELFVESEKAGGFTPVSAEEVDKAEILFENLFIGNFDQNGWSSVGYTVQNIEENGDQYRILSETADKKSGRGFFVIHISEKNPIMLQAPHSHNDKHTGKIMMKMFQEGPAMVGAWNTLPRKLAKEENRVNSDLAHLDNSYFVAITKAFAKVFPKGKIIQLHGFKSDKRTSEAGKNANIIISSGTKTPPTWVVNFSMCMKNQFQEKTLLYPFDVEELGALTNISGKSLIGMGHAGFLHVETDSNFREKLLSDKSARDKLMGCINAQS